MAAGPRATFPRYIALQELVRGLGEWARESDYRSVERVTINIEDEGVWSEITSGRCNIRELLDCSDTRYWIELVGYDGWAHQSLRLDPGTKTLESVLKDIGARNPGHLVSVYPPVRKGEENPRALERVLEDDDSDQRWLAAIGHQPPAV